MKAKELKSILDGLDDEDNVEFVLQYRRITGRLEEVKIGYASTLRAFDGNHRKIAQIIYLNG